MNSSLRLSNYTKPAIEILIGVFTLMPLLILVWFYSQIPEQIPVFLNLRGEVQVWAAKSFASVFRVPAMAIDLQLICLLMKYGTVTSQRQDGANVAPDQEHVTMLTSRLWDWLRCLVALKMAAASLEVVLLGVPGLRFLATPAWLLTWLAAIVGIFVAAKYGYRLWQLKRAKKSSPEVRIESRATRDHLIAGLIYFNRKDPALFHNTYLFNFGNKWVYLLILSLLAYPLLVFLPGPKL